MEKTKSDFIIWFLEWKEFLAVLGIAIGFLVNQYWKSVERKDKMNKESFDNMKQIKRMDLINKAGDVQEEINALSLQAMNNDVEFSKKMLEVIYNKGAIYAQVFALHNGGEHISEWSKKLVTMVTEEKRMIKASHIQDWEAVPLLVQQRKIFEHAFNSKEKFYISHDIEENMPEGDYKKLLDHDCNSLACFYMKSVQSKIYFAVFQFERISDARIEREMIKIKQMCQAAGQKKFETNLFIEQKLMKQQEIKNQLNQIDEISMEDLKK